jgi:hypothetical protein
MTGEPPVSIPFYQVSPIYSPKVITGTFDRFIGSSGTVRIIAPLPIFEGSESPIILVAII